MTTATETLSESTTTQTDAPSSATSQEPTETDKPSPELEKALKACEEDNELSAAVGAVIGSRRIYWIARNLIVKHLSKSCPDEKVLLALLKEAVRIGDNPLPPEDLIKDVAYRVDGQIRPMVLNEYTRIAEEVARVDKLEAQAAVDVRKSQPIPLGFAHINDEPLMMRERSLVVFGNPKLVEESITSSVEAIKAFNSAAPTEYCVVMHLTDSFKPQALVSSSEMGKRTTVAVGADIATGCAKSHGSFEKFMAQWLRQTYKNRVDVIVIDNLPTLTVETFVGRSPVASAHDAHRIIRRWADDHGCAVLAGIPYNEDQDVSSDIDRLSTYTDLKVV